MTTVVAMPDNDGDFIGRDYEYERTPRARRSTKFNHQNFDKHDEINQSRRQTSSFVSIADVGRGLLVPPRVNHTTSAVAAENRLFLTYDAGGYF